MKNGLETIVSVEGLAGKSFEGTITRFSQVLDETTRTMLVEVDLKNRNGDLRPGMYAKAKIGIETRGDALLLPIDAVLKEKAGSAVFKVDGGKASKVAIKTGFNDGSAVEILEGVQPNESVIRIAKTPVSNGQAVNVAEAK